MGFSVSICSQTQELLPNSTLWLSLFLSLSLPADDWSTAPPTGCVESVFLSFPNMWLEKKKISVKTHATNENIVKAQVVVCFASELCIFVLIPVDYPSYRGWRGSLCCYGPVSLPDSLRKLSRCVLLIKSVVNATSFSQTQRHYFSLSVCLCSFGDCEAFIDPELIVWDSRVSPQGRWIDARHW